MPSLRETLKQALPPAARDAIRAVRARFEPPPLEALKLHGYRLEADASAVPRLTLVLPSLDSASVFGGVATGVEVFLHCAAGLGAGARIAVDDFDQRVDQAFLAREAKRAGLEPGDIVLMHRSADNQPIGVRRNEIFFAYNWWAALNLSPLLDAQAAAFGRERLPLLQLIQEYEPLFYPMSSTHLYARSGFGDARNWAIINSTQLQAYMQAQGHDFAHDYVLEPRLSASLRPFLSAEPTPKEKVVLVYGRPAIRRNCFSAAVEGLRRLVETQADLRSWAFVSAGASHAPVPLGHGCMLRPLGKLTLEDYGARLRGAGVGLSLMASPHPSYPPLEMAHFGILTITNSFHCKDLSTAHDNITSVDQIGPDAIAGALAHACGIVERDPMAGWRGRSRMPAYLEPGPARLYQRLIPDLRSLIAGP